MDIGIGVLSLSSTSSLLSFLAFYLVCLILTMILMFASLYLLASLCSFASTSHLQMCQPAVSYLTALCDGMFVFRTRGQYLASWGEPPRWQTRGETIAVRAALARLVIEGMRDRNCEEC
jgi:hypothetical protein